MAERSAEFIASWLEGNLWRFDSPAQYLGDEPGTVRRDWEPATCRWLVAASWPYLQQAGNMSIPSVYSGIHNAGPRYLCERFYLPATPRDLGLLEKSGIPVFGVESKHQAADFDVVATSISYPVLFQNFCKYLAMSGLPLRWRDRQARAGDWPMVMVGGQSTSAPEFMAPVIDCAFLGEAEDEPGNPGVGAVCERIAGFRESGAWRQDREGCYEKLALEFSFLYFPRFTEWDYWYEDRGLPRPTKLVAGWRAVLPGLPEVFSSRKVRDLNQVQLLTEVPLLYSDPGMGAGDVEVQRGCPAWCSFCRVSWVSKPPRYESVDRTVARAQQWRQNMGSLELSPYGLHFPAHPQRKELVARLLEEVTDEVDVSSVRIDDLVGDEPYLMLQAQAGMDGLTIGLEASSQRLRDFCGKGVSDADTERVVAMAIRAGIRRIKVYMISNWPGEEEADIRKAAELGKKLAAIRDSFGEAARGVRIQFSWTPLLIEAQTPLQWFAVTEPDYRLKEIMHELKDAGVAVKIGSKASPPKLAFFQACQRASRDVGEAITDVIEDLGTASWGGFAQDMRERLDAALARRGFANGLADIFGERDQRDLLGWEHIGTGVSRRLLWDTYRRMREFAEGTSGQGYDEQFDDAYRGSEWVARCDDRCSGKQCGCCSREDLKLRQDYTRLRDRDLAASPPVPLDQSTVACRLRFKVRKPEQYRFVSAESLVFIIRRAAYRACAATGFPAIAKDTVALASDRLKFRERSAGVDYAEFGVTRPVTSDGAAEFLSAMAAHLYPWLHVTAMPSSFQVLPAQAKMPHGPALYELEVTDPVPAVRAALLKWDSAGAVPVKIRAESFYAGVQAEDGDAKAHVGDAWLVRDRHRYLLRMVLTGKLGPYQAYAALTGKASWIEAARYTARRVEFFDAAASPGGTLFRPACTGCGTGIPAGLLGGLFDGEYCPRCKDEAGGALVAGLARTGV